MKTLTINKVFVMYRYLLKAMCLAAALSTVVSCEKAPCEECRKEQEGAEYGGSGNRVKVSVKAPSATKSPAGEESAIGECILYVFDTSTGNLQYSFQDEGGVFDFTIVTGTYDFVVMANASDSQPLSKGMLLATPVLLSSSRPGHFQMYGCADAVPVLGGKELSIEVSRIVSKVDYEVTVDWRRPEYAVREFLVKGAYMTNVAGSYVIGGPEVSDVWFNMMFYAPSSASNLTFRQESVIMRQSDTLSSGRPFYVFPNCAEDCRDREVWSPRCTRFVLEASLAGETFYYPVTLPDIGPNTAFKVSLVITGPGMRHPEDTEAVEEAFEADVRVLDWETGEEIQLNY